MSAAFVPRVTLVVAVALAGTSPALAALAAPQTGEAAAFFDPRMSPAEIAEALAASGARIVRFGAAPGSVILTLPDSGSAAVRAAGALIIADPIILGGCAASPQGDSA